MTKPRISSLFLLFPFALLLLSLLFPKACMEGAKKGLEIGLFSALPSLFPGMVLSKMLLDAFPPKGGMSALLLPVVLGGICGFPTGAFVTAELCKKGLLTAKEGEKLLFFTNAPGPAFLLGFCGVEVFGNASVGWFFFGLQTLFSLLCFLFFFGVKPKKTREPLPSDTAPPLPFSLLFTDALKKSASSFLYVLSCIVFFSFLLSLTKSILPLSLFEESALSLFLEISGGIRSLSRLPRKTALVLASLGLGWGGISVHVQSMGFFSEANLSPKKYFLGKLVSALFLLLGTEIFGKCL